MPAGAFLFLKKSVLTAYMPAGAFFGLKKSVLTDPRPTPDPTPDPQGSPMAPEPPEATLGRHFPSQVAESDGRVAKK